MKNKPAVKHTVVTQAQTGVPVPELFASLGIKHVTKADEFSITYKNGLIKANVRRADGSVNTVVKSVSGNGFIQFTSVNQEEFEPGERDQRIRDKYKEGCTQKDIAEYFGLSQSMISAIVRSGRT